MRTSSAMVAHALFAGLLVAIVLPTTVLVYRAAPLPHSALLRRRGLLFVGVSLIPLVLSCLMLAISASNSVTAHNLVTTWSDVANPSLNTSALVVSSVEGVDLIVLDRGAYRGPAMINLRPPMEDPVYKPDIELSFGFYPHYRNLPDAPVLYFEEGHKARGWALLAGVATYCAVACAISWLSMTKSSLAARLQARWGALGLVLCGFCILEAWWGFDALSGMCSFRGIECIGHVAGAGALFGVPGVFFLFMCAGQRKCDDLELFRGMSKLTFALCAIWLAGDFYLHGYGMFEGPEKSHNSIALTYLLWATCASIDVHVYRSCKFARGTLLLATLGHSLLIWFHGKALEATNLAHRTHVIFVVLSVPAMFTRRYVTVAVCYVTAGIFMLFAGEGTSFWAVLVVGYSPIMWVDLLLCAPCLMSRSQRVRSPFYVCTRTQALAESHMGYDVLAYLSLHSRRRQDATAGLHCTVVICYEDL